MINLRDSLQKDWTCRALSKFIMTCIISFTLAFFLAILFPNIMQSEEQNITNWQSAAIIPFIYYVGAGGFCLICTVLILADCIGKNKLKLISKIAKQKTLAAIGMSVLPGMFFWITMSLFIISWSGSYGWVGSILGIIGSLSLIAGFASLVWAVNLLFK